MGTPFPLSIIIDNNARELFSSIDFLMIFEIIYPTPLTLDKLQF